MFFQINRFFSGLNPKDGTRRRAANRNDSAAKQAKAAAFLIVVHYSSVAAIFSGSLHIGKGYLKIRYRYNWASQHAYASGVFVYGSFTPAI